MEYIDYKKKIFDGVFKDDWYILGINFGNTSTSVSFYNKKSNKCEYIDLSMGFGKISIASVVQLMENTQEWIVGDEAFKTKDEQIDNTVINLLQKLNDNDKIKVGDSFYFVEDIVARLFEYIFESILKISPKSEIIGIVITVPNYFGKNQKDKIINSLDIIGYKDRLIDLIDEATASLYTYMENNAVSENERILLCDIGGATTNMYLLDTINVTNTNIKFQLVNEYFRSNNGSSIVDELLIKKFYKYLEENGIAKDTLSPSNISELRQKAIDTKERLSSVNQVRVPFAFCVPPFVKQIKYEEYLDIIDSFIADINNAVDNMLIIDKNNNVNIKDINKILLSGGFSATPAIKNIFINYNFKDESIVKIKSSSTGACIYATKVMFETNTKIIEIESYRQTTDIELKSDIGILIQNEFCPIIKRGSSLICLRKEKSFLVNNEDKNNNFTLTLLQRGDVKDTLDKCIKLYDVNISFEDMQKDDTMIVKLQLALKNKGTLLCGNVTMMADEPVILHTFNVWIE